MNKQPILLGAEGAGVPVPDGDLDLEEKDVDVVSPTRKRGGQSANKSEEPNPKKEKNLSDTVTLDVAKIRGLLVEQSRELLSAQQSQLNKAVQEMEAKVESRVCQVEEQVASLAGQNVALESKVTQLETALQELADTVKGGGSGGRVLPGVDEGRRRSTLVIGGWPRDSRRQTILKELNEAIRTLNLGGDIDQEAFCTGPRRSLALLPMTARPGEPDADKRARMFKVVSAFASNQVVSGAGTKLWCSFSKTPEERAVAAHASLIKRVVAEFDADIAQNSLDFEYKTGTAWGPDGMLCSAHLPVPPKHDHKGIDEVGEAPFKKWIDVGLLARLVSKPPKKVREMIEQCRAVENGFHFSLFGWNVGGCDISDLASAIQNATSRPLAPDAVLALQELPRAGVGWATEKQGSLQILSHRCDESWRGAGVAFKSEVWSVARRVASGRGVWVQLKHMKVGSLVWVGSVHLTPGATHSQSEQEMSEFLRGMPKGANPVVCQCDANAGIRWSVQDEHVMAVGLDGKANGVLDQLKCKHLQVISPTEEQFGVPTSRPRQVGRRGHIIDYMSVSGVAGASLYVHVDSHIVLGTDHELLEGSLVVRKGSSINRFSTKPRVWCGGVDRIESLDQRLLVDLARRCTKVVPGRGYRDPPDVKAAVQRARKKWEAERLARASQGAQKGDPHTVLHDHLASVYSGDGVRPNEGVYPGSTKGFDMQELRTALGQMKTGKSVGVDGTSAELLKALADLPGGAEHLLEFMTRTLVTHEVPPDWNVPLMVILAKVGAPTEAKHLRPISMGSAAGKLFSRMLLNRTLPFVSARTHSQCAGVGRQSSDFLYPVWRVLMLEREWHAGACLVKLDIAKAFDTVDREQLLRKLQSRMGDCSEMRCWRALLQDGEAVLQSPWGTSLLGMTRGIKQGAVESPALFAMVAEVCLAEAARRFQWQSLGELFPGMPHHDVLFMDDCILWHIMISGVKVEAVSEMEVVAFCWASVQMSPQGVGGCYGFAVGEWEANEDTGARMFHTRMKAFCLPFMFSMWLHVAWPCAPLCGGNVPAGRCEDRRVLKDLCPSTYMIMPKIDVFSGERWEAWEPQGEECMGPHQWPLGAFRDWEQCPVMFDRLELGYGTVGVDVDGDTVVMMQGYLRKDVGPRADGIPRRDFEELVADFRQLVDAGDGRRARRDLAHRVQCRQPARVRRFMQEVLGECFNDDMVLPLEARRYSVDVETWVDRLSDCCANMRLCRVCHPVGHRLEPTLPFHSE
ncbi:unnamed protein product [Symbiodinium sp. KB8]|nr:unnamed protein product [Symbiodinium sp. KB8]